MHVAPVERHRDLDRRALIVVQELDRLGGQVDVVILLVLPAVWAEHLGEVSLGVEQADAHERQAKVAGGLEVVAGEHAEAAGVARQALRERELEGKVGDDVGAAGAGHGCVRRTPKVGLEGGADALEMRQEAVVMGEPLDLSPRHELEHPRRVVAGRAPELAIHALEEQQRVGVPCPEEVADDGPERLEGGWKLWFDLERPGGAKSHGNHCSAAACGARERGRQRGPRPLVPRPLVVRTFGPCEHRSGYGRSSWSIFRGQPANSMPFRAVLFDIGDTLWHSRGAPPVEEFRRLAAQRAAEELRKLGVNHADPATVARSAWTALEDAMRRARATDLVEPDYAAVSQAALGRLGIDLSRTQAGELLEATYVSGIEGGKSPYPDARETLLALRRRGFLLATVTNRAFGGERFRADLRDVGLDIGWDAEAVSVEVGYLKPHPAIFRFALDRLDARPSDVLMVGNSLAEDVAGAQAVGIAAAWKRSAPDAEGVRPDFVFDQLAELLDRPELQAHEP